MFMKNDGLVYIKTHLILAMCLRNVTLKIVYIFQPMKEWEMYLVLSIFLVMDVIALSVWQIKDPLYRKLEYFPNEKPEYNTKEDIEMKPELEHCSSENLNIWLGKSMFDWSVCPLDSGLQVLGLYFWNYVNPDYISG